MKAQTVFQDAREVRTKARKTFVSTFFPVGPEPAAIIADYIAMLKGELGFPHDYLVAVHAKWGGARTGALSPKACLGCCGAARSRYGRFSARPSRLRDCRDANPHSFTKRLALHGGFADFYEGRGKGLFAEFRPRKYRDDARELREPCRRIFRRKSCGRLACHGKTTRQRVWTSLPSKPSFKARSACATLPLDTGGADGNRAMTVSRWIGEDLPFGPFASSWARAKNERRRNRGSRIETRLGAI